MDSTRFSGEAKEFSSPVAYFRDIRERLVERIDKADVVLGCVAWLTCPIIIESLSRKAILSIVSHREPWLSKDHEWSVRMRLSWHMFGDYGLFRRFGPSFPAVSVRGRPQSPPPTVVVTPAVRILGKTDARMHHKFVLFGRVEQGYNPVSPHDGTWVPPRTIDLTEVWTGSFNFTETATRSFENAIVLDDPDVVEGFYLEFVRVISLSEELR